MIYSDTDIILLRVGCDLYRLSIVYYVLKLI